jgi:hypothetical protein
MRPSPISPERTARSTDLYARSRFGGISRMSAPALIASTGTRSSPNICRTPSIVSASVTMAPSKSIRLRSSPVRIGLDSVAGRPEPSSAGTTMWAVMIDSTPASIAASNGGRSMRSSSARV